MRAVVCPAYGPPEVLVVDDVPVPLPGTGEVLVQVAAAAVNFPDLLFVAGEYQRRLPPPFVPGSELAGVVTALGPGASGFEVGDRVFGSLLHGAFAEQAAVPAAALRHTPATVDDRAAAAFGVAHRTAFHSLRSVAAVQPGEQVVVLGASGGVGLAAVELATLLGADVTAVASSAERLGVAAGRGARHLVDRTAGPLRNQLRATLPDGADVVLDPVGGDLAEPALRSLRWGGRYVTVGYASGTIPRLPLNLVLLKGVRVEGFDLGGFVAHRPVDAAADEDALLALFAAGRVGPHIGATFALEDTAAALRAVSDGRVIGKAIVVPRGNVVLPPR